MLLTFILGLITLLTAIGFGQFLLPKRWIVGPDNKPNESLGLAAILGFLAMMPIANMLSIWFSANIFAPYLLVIGLLLGLWHIWQNKYLGQITKHVKPAWWYLSGVGILLLICLMKGSAPSFYYDYGSYYLPTIKWANEYAVVPGLANIATRLGFNSSWHVLQAVFSYQWLTPLIGLAVYDLNECLLFAFGLLVLDQIRTAKTEEGNQLATLFLTLSTPFWAWVIPDFLTSPSPDLPVMILYWLCIWSAFKVVEANRGDNRQGINYWLTLCWILATAVVTIKLSGLVLIGLPCLLTLWVLVKYGIKQWIGGKNAWQLWSGPVFGIVSIGLWSYRTAIITGYLLYPVPALPAISSIFGKQVDWVLPAQEVDIEVANVTLFAQFGAGNPYLAEPLAHKFSIAEWVPIWWDTQLDIPSKICILLAIVALGVLPITLLAGWYKARKTQDEDSTLHLIGLSIWVILLLNFMLWGLKGPALRFGFSFIVPLLILCFWFITHKFWTKRKFMISQWGWFCTIIFIPLLFTARDLRGFKTYPLKPSLVQAVTLQRYTNGLQEIPIYHPLDYYEGENLTPAITADVYCKRCVQCWLAPLPCVPIKSSTWAFRGTDLQAGFKPR